ncbi:hypothetical protein C0J52_16893 [Blattella germanica]|nr:hypothetical protein C0J52_16893 [Blattella germanica]
MTMTPEEVTRVIALFEDGRSIRYIANVLRVARNTVHDVVKRYQEIGEYSRRPGSGRPRATNNRDDRILFNTPKKSNHVARKPIHLNDTGSFPKKVRHACFSTSCTHFSCTNCQFLLLYQ